ncbi:hypothetical protein AOL_s00173g193 [Orbilia oligospora ATCC 24927]|uniref:Uncharacterized protein n=1 Tax=Arthrobotrys oligospora (strain ATCC 24927 / CBS 115.81 / DSM 1491) TaxID=756982 RepID=G1XP25_ARTOA|nr:hypothetical protein AOL_s00173g193 [Orbilia oligospora ATCC 24927]EGX45092.1 hypothetical protein AOL_s00173g193 [Orbilia oligospora ATCC 24927]
MNGFKDLHQSALKQYCVVEIGSVAYFVRNRVEKTLPEEYTGVLPPLSIVPAVLLNVQADSPITRDFLEKSISTFSAIDDVFTLDFIKNGIIIAQVGRDETSTQVSSELESYLTSKNIGLLFSRPTSHLEAPLPQGPYILRGRNIHQPWRLYEDHLRAFVTAVFPADDGNPHGFQPLRAGAYNGLYPVVAVPSRIYYPATKDKPLNGKRITVKDIYFLAGIKKTLGSRAYTECYGPDEETSQFIQELIDQGAIILGKTKMGAYAGSEIPPEKCIDYFAPWNPRGDGYQGPSGSSSGAGATVAGYDWVDLSLGGDTSGSIRMPAASYGLWGLKGTDQAFPMKNIMPNVEAFDSIGILGRSPQELVDILKASGFASLSQAKLPSKIYYLTDWFPMKNDAQQAMVESFLKILENYVGIKHEKVSIAAEWLKSGPEDVRHLTVVEFLAKTGYYPNHYDGYHVYDKFRSDYQKKFGKKPYTSPFMERRWNRGKESSPENRQRSIDEMKVFRDWIFKTFLETEADGISGPIMLIPLGRPGNNPRDVVPPAGPEFAPTAYDSIFFSSIVGIPQAIIPIGQNPYQSRASGNTEYAPIVASFAGVRGSDLILIELAQKALERAGWPIIVQTGPNIFDLGESQNHPERIIRETSKLS